MTKKQSARDKFIEDCCDKFENENHKEAIKNYYIRDDFYAEEMWNWIENHVEEDRKSLIKLIIELIEEEIRAERYSGAPRLGNVMINKLKNLNK